MGKIPKKMKETVLHRPSRRVQRFVALYLICDTAKEAALKAGFSSNPGSQASRLLRREQVSLAIEQARRELADRHKIDQDKIIKMLLDAYNKASEKGDAMAMLGAAKEIGVFCGLY
jgi:phage terminase small subunit